MCSSADRTQRQTNWGRNSTVWGSEWLGCTALQHLAVFLATTSSRLPHRNVVSEGKQPKRQHVQTAVSAATRSRREL